ncbi:DUF819 family protein [Staphylococcus chromogenes]|uniref:DUF819 family protein n=1 Tax=Staphylococcus chromogenes TaxID=46126 RepID=UPI000D1AA8E6|nr:DUF819 family protein [Staphylococcus chromogenes]PTF73256.1 hypothetical protein BUY01_01795 [Staphylococcus chromogenes]PTF73378.1 hypothetical protein BUY03_02230 [Staphylococcus chromogenes]PTG84585.1 hypothetical protein BU665_03140 [Staphylococcus chromogenes]PUZ20251.1 DUF819 domain-containing protein [Staphylococcus chromogenes]TRL27848.1 DUF819 domain-containing protein [Staphylococcus chromogenes]
MLLSTIISPDQNWILLAFIVGWAAISILLEQRFKWAQLISGAILALLGAMLLSNFKIIPTEAPVYDMVWDYLVPLAIPLLLFQSNIKKIWRESQRLLVIFLIASIGTMIGVSIAFLLLHSSIPHLDKIAAMMTGSYIGGGVNFAALSAKFQTPSDLISSTVVADNSVMALYFMLLMILPQLRWVQKWFRTETRTSKKETTEADYWQATPVHLYDIAIALGLSVAIVAVSFTISDILKQLIPSSWGLLQALLSFVGDPYLLITTITLGLVMKFERFFEKLNGTNEFGTFMIYIFFVVIGIPASFHTIFKTAPLLFIFVLTILIFNLGLTLIVGRLFHFKIEEMLLASNATAGGPTTAAALAISKGWHELIGPILIVGTLGYVIGNYAGTLMYHLLH